MIAEQSLTTITSIKALIHNILNVKLLSAYKIACQVQYLVDEDVDPSLNDLGKEALLWKKTKSVMLEAEIAACAFMA